MNKWFKGIRGKLLVAACLPLLGLGAIIGISINSSNMLGGLLDDSFTRVIPNLMAISEIRGQRGNIFYNAWAAVSLATTNKKASGEFRERVKESITEFKKGIKDYESNPFSPGEAEIYEKFKVKKEEFYADVDKVIKYLEEDTPESLKQAETLLEGPLREHGVLIRVYAKSVADLYAKAADINDKEQQTSRAFVRNLIVFAGLASMFLVFGLLMWIAYNISNSVGDVASKLSDSTGQVTQAIEQLSAAGQALSESSTESAASLEETVASLEEMTSMVQMNSDHAREAAGLAHTSREAAEKGEKEIQTLVTSMQGISQASKKIEEIIHVIDDIAFQTNLLALNAAVEAARAGEQGKGFAVVADAVRTLAQKSAEAAKDITSLIKDSVHKIDEGTDIADKSGVIMVDIVSAVKKVSDLANEIASASSEQTSGIQQISKAMNQLDQGAQSNAASSEEIASTSEEIASQATQMQNLVEKLNSVVLGTTTVPVIEAAPSAKKAAPHAEKAKKPNVVKFTPKKEPSKNQTAGQAVIPFDEDETPGASADGRGKIGDVSGF